MAKVTSTTLNTLNSLGLFSQPSYMGDEYLPKFNVSDRYKGRNMMTSPGKKGHGADTTFSQKVLSLSEGDKYVDPGLHDRRQKMDHNKKRLYPGVFRPSSPPKHGQAYGTFGGFEHKPDTFVTKKGDPSTRFEPKLRNILTNPPKRGTYGFPGLTIGKPSEYRDKADPYESERRFTALEEKRSQRAAGQPFKSSCRRIATFDETGHGVSRVYSLEKQMPVRKISIEPPKAAIVPWIPGNPGKKGFNCTKYPEYKEDPLDAKEKARREERRKKNATTTNRWLPISGPKSMATRTIDLDV